MSFPNEIIRNIYLSQILIGVLGNSFLIFLYSTKFNNFQKTRTRILILIHFLFTNILLFLFRGIPQTIEVWGIKYSVNSTVSRFITYLQRVTRSLSLCSCFNLVLLQAITISPNRFLKAKIKTRFLNSIFPFFLLCWVLNLMIDAVLPAYVMYLKNITQIKEEEKIGLSALALHAENTKMFLIFKVFHDVVYVILMAIASVYIALFLCTHHQKLQQLHIISHSQGASPEIHAVTAILLLGSTFVTFTVVASIFVMYMVFSEVPTPVLIHISVFLSMCFQTVSPFILLRSDTQILRYFCTHWQMQRAVEF